MTGVATRDDLLASAYGLQGCLREFADYGDTHRRTADQVIEGLTAAGMFRLLTPRRYGGHQADLGTLVEVTDVLGEADASAAWLVCIAAMGAWTVAHAQTPAQDEVFGVDPDALVAGGITDSGAGVLVEGGAVVTGRWRLVSGALHARWAVVMSQIRVRDERAVETAFCVMPITDVRIEDTWHVTGLRGTGSNTIVATDVFVPEHRLIHLTSFSRGSSSAPGALYRLPMQPVGALILMGPLLGAGRAALDHVLEAAARAGLPHTGDRGQRGSAAAQFQLTDAALKLQNARSLVYLVVDRLTQQVAARHIFLPRDRALARAEVASASQLVVAAVNELLATHGSGSLADAGALDRVFRDISVGAQHDSLDPGVASGALGKALFGDAEQTTSTAAPRARMLP